MCGIAGILKGESHYSEQQMTEFVNAMCQTLVHRGPDNQGVWMSDDKQCVLGHRRLSIIDLSNKSHQPIASQQAGLTFNGEIYNYIELAQQLHAKGLNRQANSDTQTLLAGLDDSSENFITKLDGMFAFGYYDQVRQQLLLARDPFGEKPVYFTEINGAIVFASEITAFNAIPDFVGQVTADHLSLYLYFQYPPAPYTIFANVFKVSPGSYKRFSANQAYPEISYYSPEFGARTSSLNKVDATQVLDSVLSESLQRRLRSDVSLGAFLSGGVDSSTVVSLIAKKFDHAIDTYSVGFLQCDKSEHEEAKRISQHLGTHHHTLMFDSRQYVDYVDLMVDHCEPNADTSCIPTFLVSELTARDHKVAITGDGGDELFGGYNRYYSTMHAAKGKEQAIKERTWHLGNQYVNSLNIVPHKELRTLFGVFPSLLNDILLQSRRHIDVSLNDYLARFQQTDLQLYLPTVLSKVDRTSMAHSLETRTPFLSTDVFQFAGSLSPSLLFNEKHKKVVLRSVLSQYLPDNMIQRNKVGFSFVGENEANALALIGLKQRFNDECRSSKSFIFDFFGPLKLALFNQDLHLCSQTKQLQMLWALLLLNSFMKNCRYKIII
jgi:asparagine synthase (glutamine-hydrolysing)